MASGVARDDRGTPNGSMGVDAGDPDGTGKPSLWVTNYENELHALYRNDSCQGRARSSPSSTAGGGHRGHRPDVTSAGARLPRLRPRRLGGPVRRQRPRHPLPDRQGRHAPAAPGAVLNQGDGKFQDVSDRRLGAYFRQPTPGPRRGVRRPGQRRPHRPGRQPHERAGRRSCATSAARATTGSGWSWSARGTPRRGRRSRHRSRPAAGRRRVRQGRRQLRLVDRPPALFGLGTRKIDKFTVVWPDGRVPGVARRDTRPLPRRHAGEEGTLPAAAAAIACRQAHHTAGTRNQSRCGFCTTPGAGTASPVSRPTAQRQAFAAQSSDGFTSPECSGALPGTGPPQAGPV